jgi:hypothetical protein
MRLGRGVVLYILYALLIKTAHIPWVRVWLTKVVECSYGATGSVLPDLLIAGLLRVTIHSILYSPRADGVSPRGGGS